MSDIGTAALLVVLGVIGLVVTYIVLRIALVWLYVAATILAMFTFVVAALPPMIVIPVFIIFPPAFVAFLLGLACRAYLERSFEQDERRAENRNVEWSYTSAYHARANPRARASRAQRREAQRRRSMGYDE